MKVRRSQGVMISLQGTSIMKGLIAFCVSFLLVFILTGMLTSLQPQYRITSSSINKWTESFSTMSLVRILGFENPYFTQNVPAEAQKIQFSKLAFELTTNINPDDPRSLLGREIPGFSLFDGKILVAGEGTNYTNMPYESAPPLEVQLKERQASAEQLKKAEASAKAPISTNGKKVVYIYQTHTRESYLPLLEGVTNIDEAYHDKANVTLVGSKLQKELEARGIGAIEDKTDFTNILLAKGLKYPASYDASRPVVKKALADNKDLKYLIDIHRDSRPKKTTTATINNKKYARTTFVVGGENAQFEKNLKVATDLHHMLEKKYPGISRGVTTKQGKGTNGKFNQDLSEDAMLVEFGGVYNTVDELNRTAEAFAEVFSEYYKQAEQVNQ